MRRVGWHRAGPARALWLGALLIAVTALGGPPAAAAPTSRDTLRRAPIELRLPADIQPTDGQPHTFNWQVMVARKTPDGAYMVVGRKSVIYTFTLQNP